MLTFWEGEVVIRRGQENASLYIVLEGAAVAVIEDAERTLPRGAASLAMSPRCSPNEPPPTSSAGRNCSAWWSPRISSRATSVANPRVMCTMLQVEARRLRSADGSFCA